MSTPLLERFVSEARDLLQLAASGLLILERQPGDEAAINDVFRSVHTLKGSAGLFDFPAFIKLVHAGEDVLSAVRGGQLGMTSELVDKLLDALDQVSAWIDAIAAQGTLPDGADGLSKEITASLRAVLPSDFGTSQAQSPAPQTGALLALDWLTTLPEQERLAAFAAVMAGGELLAIEYVPLEDCFFSGEDPFALLRQVGQLHSVTIEPTEPWPTIDNLDPYRCILRFRALSTAPRAEVETLFRYVVEQVQVAVVPPQALISLSGDSNSEPTPISPPQPSSAVPDFANSPSNGLGSVSPMAIHILESQRALLVLPLPPDGLASRLDSVAQTVANLLNAEKRRAADSALWAAAVEAALAQDSVAPVVEILDQWLVVGDGSAAAAMLTGADQARRRSEASDHPTPEIKQASRVLKVDQAKVDALMNLIGELVVSKNSLPFLAKRAEQVHGSREMSREIKDLYAVIDRLAQEMQAAIMAVRMLPVSEVFDRFPRLVRDVARKLGKHIDLVIEGADTAADKNIIEALGDPLLHIVRNAIDHGIETPDQREATGKPSQATILLHAFQEGDQVIIEVVDDGRGIDPEKIKASALEKGIIDEEGAARLTDQEAVNLVFTPGFSTAAKVSDLSGRGVGMDVVVNGVEKTGGSVSITSIKGQGTTVRLSLPLSMAVTRVMVVEAGGGMLFGIPMDNIAETVRVHRAAVRRFKQAEAFVLRDAIVPLIRLEVLMGMPPSVWIGDGSEEDAVLVVRVGTNLVGLVVDHFREGMDIILKPFDGILSGIRGYSGSALLGDGRVLLVLNLKELL